MSVQFLSSPSLLSNSSPSSSFPFLTSFNLINFDVEVFKFYKHKILKRWKQEITYEMILKIVITMMIASLFMIFEDVYVIKNGSSKFYRKYLNNTVQNYVMGNLQRPERLSDPVTQPVFGNCLYLDQHFEHSCDLDHKIFDSQQELVK